MRDAGLIWCAIMTGIIFVWYIISLIRDNAFQSGYWKGRADGFKVANMRNLNRIKTDEVFDYEKN
jgi:hypothetical protein